MKTAHKALAFCCTFAATCLVAGPIEPAHASELNNPISLAEVVELQKQDFNRAKQIALAVAPVRSAGDLAMYVRSVPSAHSPLSQLSPQARGRFLRSLTFNEQGLTGFNYGDLSTELTASEIHRILALFGAQHTLGAMKNVRSEDATDSLITTQWDGGYDVIGDHEGYYCESKSNCRTRSQYICMSSC